MSQSSVYQLSTNPRSLRQFATAWLLFLLALAAQQWFKRGHHTAGLVLAPVAIVVGVAGLVRPTSIRWIFAAAMGLTFPIGWVISQCVVVLMFYLVVTPVALFFKITGRDLLCRKPAPDKVTYWMAKPSPTDMRSYFRQH